MKKRYLLFGGIIIIAIFLVGGIIFVKNYRNQFGTDNQANAIPKEFDHISILEYHSIRDTTDNDPLVVNDSKFKAQMDYLKSNGYVTWTLKHLTEYERGNLKVSGKPVIITFDDGIASVYNNAHPIMKKNSQRAVIFVVPNWLGTKSFLTWKDTKALADYGHEIGSHSLDHIHPIGLSTAQLEIQVYRSRRILEDNLQIGVSSYSYPYGEFNIKLLDILAKSKYVKAVSAEAGTNPLPITQPYLLKRQFVSNTTTLEEFKKLL